MGVCPFRDVLTWGKRDGTLFLCVSLSMDLPPSPRRRIALGQANLFCLDNTQRKLGMASLVAQMVKCLPAMWETRVQSLGQEDPLEKEMATHSSTLAWKIPGMEKPGRLQSMGSQRVGHD